MNSDRPPSWRRITRRQKSPSRQLSFRSLSDRYLESERWRDFAVECVFFILIAIIVAVSLAGSANDLVRFV